MKFISQVIHGRAHGRTIGYPTANLPVTEAMKQMLNKEGVYAVRVNANGKEYMGALFYGQRSLFADEKPICEVLILDFAGDLYGQELEVEIIKYLRPVVAAKDEVELNKLIAFDIKNVKKLITNY